MVPGVVFCGVDVPGLAAETVLFGWVWFGKDSPNGPVMKVPVRAPSALMVAMVSL